MYYNNRNVSLARKLRKDMTPWERKLWYCALNKYPVRFYRQKPIGNYIVDFYCPKANLVIELDGSGHYDPVAEQQDRDRTAELEKLGIKVIRFCNLDIERNLSGVFSVIDEQVNSRIVG